MRTACARLELSGLALSGQGSQSAGFAKAGCLKFSGLWLAALWESVQSPSVGAKSEAFGFANSQWAARLPFAACGPSRSEAPCGQVASRLLWLALVPNGAIQGSEPALGVAGRAVVHVVAKAGDVEAIAFNAGQIFIAIVISGFPYIEAVGLRAIGQGKLRDRKSVV